MESSSQYRVSQKNVPLSLKKVLLSQKKVPKTQRQSLVESGHRRHLVGNSVITAPAAAEA